MEKQRKKFKMPSTYGTLAAFIILVALLSWVVPGGTYEYVDPTADKLQPIAGSYQPAESNPQNLFDVLAAPINGFLDSVDIILYTLNTNVKKRLK